MRKKKSIRYKSSRKLFGYPLLAIAAGPDEETGETRGIARGIIAIGDVAVGLIAIGGAAGGIIAIGGLAIGLLTVGGVALGALVIGGVAVGFGAFGGVAVGQYARGGAAVGTHVMCAKKQDPEAEKFFSMVMPGTVTHREPQAAAKED